MRLGRNSDGSASVEFAFVAPAFLMFLFLILDGGRMIFTKQALNELAAATARCAALKSSSCADASKAQTWATDRAGRSANMLGGVTASVEPSVSCNGQTSMARATMTLNYVKGIMNLLPQSAVPSQLVSISCFPVAS